MVDKKDSIPQNIGNTRWKYLDFANMSFAQGNFVQCKGYIDSFMETIDEKTEAGKTLKTEFDDIYSVRKEIEKSIESKARDMGYLEKKDFEDMVRRELELDTLQNIKSSCWRICLKYGLFYE